MSRLRKIDQTLFGGKDAPLDQLGNCLQACVAMVTGRALADVPHFQALDESPAVCDRAMQAWLREHGFRSMRVGFSPQHVPGYIVDVPVIVAGLSPRLEGCLHAVVGSFDVAGRFHLFHDPHPSRAGIGDIAEVEVVFRHAMLADDAMVRRFVDAVNPVLHRLPPPNVVRAGLEAALATRGGA